MKMWVQAAAIAAMVSMGTAAMAQSAMQGDAMHGDAMHGAMAAGTPTMVCRAAAKGETPTAKMASGDLVCKKIDMAAMMKNADEATKKQLMSLMIPLSSAQDAPQQ